MKKVLVMGGTGVMGAHLVPELLKMGFQVDVVSLENKESIDDCVIIVFKQIL